MYILTQIWLHFSIKVICPPLKLQKKNISILTKTWTISFMAEPREKVKHRTGGQRSSSKTWKQQFSSKRWKQIVTIAESRFSAKEGASRSDQARPKTNMQVSLLTIILSGFEAEKKGWLLQMPSDTRREVRRWEKRGAREVQRQRGGPTQPS